MRILIAALVACVATVALGQTQAGTKSAPAPHATLPQSWQDAQRSFAMFGAPVDKPGSVSAGAARSPVAVQPTPPQTVARNENRAVVPIPGEWPNLKTEPIPTTWPKGRLLLVESGAPEQSALKK